MGTHPNPVKVAREENNLSQNAFASLAGVTPQVVVRSELGMYPELNPTIERTIRTLTGKPDTEIEREYQLYILSELATVKLPLSIPLDAETLRRQISTIEGMLQFRKDLTSANEVSDSNYSLCKLLKVHIYPIERFLKGRKDTPPIQILERMEEIWTLHDLN